MRGPDRWAWWYGGAVGLAGVTAVLAGAVAIRDHIPHTVPAFLLLIPIVAASVIAGWRVAVPVAVVAALGVALLFLPPIGSVRVSLSEDMLILVTFVVVAIAVGALKSPRPLVEPDDVVTGRVMLLRGVSHDLRNPLSTIKTISSELLDGPERYDSATTHALLHRVVDESDRLERIVGNLLSASRVDAGSLVPALEAQPIGPIITRTVTRLDHVPTHTIRVEVESGLHDVLVDDVQIDQVLTNLVDNALRHTPAGTTVLVRARAHADGCEVVVADDGPGLAAAGTTRRAGLGLTVCRAIVEAHGGTLDVREPHSRRGTVAAFTLRRAA
ncbi:MAG: PAS domain-containing sensor histidine kinase [Actinobacteria bacterium]|nr:PAS domain-containing sensor histidine kinase [Actinomycetota bacterium]